MLIFGKNVKVSDCGLKSLDDVRRSELAEVSIISQVYRNAIELDLLLFANHHKSPARQIPEPSTISSSGTDFAMGLAIGSIIS